MSDAPRGQGEVVLETRRLVLREFTRADVELLLVLDRDPEVQRYVDSGHAPTPEVMEHDVLPRLISLYETTPGFGFFPAFEKATGAYIGWFHFRVSKEDPAEIDLGYQLLRAAWGKGYATEGSLALVRRGFLAQGVTRVVAFALVANGASTRVMEKVGLQIERYFEKEQTTFPDRRAVKYGMTRAEWEALAGEAGR